MDGAILGSVEIALAKAKTSILFNGPSENLWEFCKPGGPAPATEYTNGGLIPYAGGVALNGHDGTLIGAIGVSGGLAAQDGEVARGPYDTGFNDRITDTTYRWHDGAVNFTREADIKASFAEIMQGQFDPQEMIDEMVAVIGADDGKYRNVWPPSIEDLIKQVHENDWTRPVQRLPTAAGV